MQSEIFTVIDEINILLTNINGKTIELSRLLVTLDIYESIFDFFISGKLVLQDSLDIIKNFIIIGNEQLKVVIHTTDTNKSITLNFRIYKIIPDTTNTKGDSKKKVVELYFLSEEAIKNNKTLISKKFSDNPENIIQDVITNHLSSSKILNSETTSDSVNVYSNFWKASKLINFITKISKNDNYSDYIFFETFDGFIFKTISNLINQNKVQDVSYNTKSDSFIGNTNIKIYKFNTFFDINKSLNDGLFGMTFYNPGGTDYSYTKETVKLDDNYNSIVTNGASKHFDPALSDEKNIVVTNFYEPAISKIRLASLKLLQNYNLTIKLNGDFGRKSGDNLNVEFPNLDNETALNESFSGNWFIKGIRHTIQQKNVYEQNIEICKNAFFNNMDLESINSLIKV